MYRAFGKRALDLTLSLAVLILVSPVLSFVALLIRLGLGRPVLFRQIRPGLGGRPFTILKFRTMTEPVVGEAARDQRIPPLGAWLRSASLDELPQLVNVLRGDMSLVGPRPLRVEYLTRYSTEQARRHEVLPGVTGWAQVNGRNALSWERKFELDVWYVDHVSFGLDLRILALTAARLVRPKGISAAGHETMPDFMGSKESGK